MTRKPPKKLINDPYLINPPNTNIGPTGPTGPTGPVGSGGGLINNYDNINLIAGITGTIDPSTNLTLINTQGVTGKWVSKIDYTSGCLTTSDINGNIYTIYSRTFNNVPPVIFNSNGITGSTFNSGDTATHFLTKFDIDGNVLWNARIIGEQTSSMSGSIVCDDTGDNIYFTLAVPSGYSVEYYNSDTNGGTLGFTLSNNSTIYSQTYLCKYTTDGVVLWATKFQGNAFSGGAKRNITFNNNNIYALTHISSNYQFWANNVGEIDSGFTFTFSDSDNNLALVAYNTDGTCVNANIIESLVGIPTSINSIMSSNNNIYVASRIQQNDALKLHYSINSNNIGITLNKISNNTYNAIFFTKYNENLQPQWINTIHGNIDTDVDISYTTFNITNSISENNITENIFIISSISNNSSPILTKCVFNSTDGNNIYNSDNIDFYPFTIYSIASYDTDGKIKWVNNKNNLNVLLSGSNSDDFDNTFLFGSPFNAISPIIYLNNRDGTTYTGLTNTYSTSGTALFGYVVKQNNNGYFKSHLITGATNCNLDDVKTNKNGEVIMLSFMACVDDSLINTNISFYHGNGTTFVNKTNDLLPSSTPSFGGTKNLYIVKYIDTYNVNLSTPTSPLINKVINAKNLNGSNVIIHTSNLKVNNQDKSIIKMRNDGESINLGWSGSYWYVIDNNGATIE